MFIFSAKYQNSLICRRKIKELIFDIFLRPRLAVVVDNGRVADRKEHQG